MTDKQKTDQGILVEIESFDYWWWEDEDKANLLRIAKEGMEAQEDLITENERVEKEMDELMVKNLKLIKENEKLEKVIGRKDVSLNHLRGIMNEPF